ncbi:MAG: DMT family transporter, partial [Sandaracinaceae bacterium]|nr:DMT family transporter [Sandaracinaceae bacterium]
MSERSFLSPGARAMVIAAFAFSVMSVLVKLAGERLPTSQVVLARGVVTLAMSAWAIHRRKLSFAGNRKGLLLLRGVFGFGGLFCYFYAVTHLPLADATVLHFVNPVLSVLVAAIVLRERAGLIEIAGALVALAGVVLVARPTLLFGQSELDPFAVGVALAGACFAAGAYVTVRSLRGSDDPLVVVFYFPLIAVPATLPFAIPAWVWPRPIEWLVLLGVGVATQIGQVQMTRALHLESTARATTLSYVQVIFAFGWGLLLFHEVPSLLGIAGALVIAA